MNFANKIVDYSEALMNKVMRLVPSASGKMLYNKWILYFIFVVALVDLVQFYMRGNTNALIFFFSIGFLTTFFSKNMTVVLVIALALTHIVSYGTGALEGMDNGEEEEDTEEEDTAEEEEDATKEEESFASSEKSIKDTAKTVALLSSDANAKDLPAQTVELLNKQKELMANMDNLKPLLKQAEAVIKTAKTEPFTGLAYAEFK